MPVESNKNLSINHNLTYVTNTDELITLTLLNLLMELAVGL